MLVLETYGYLYEIYFREIGKKKVLVYILMLTVSQRELLGIHTINVY